MCLPVVYLCVGVGVFWGRDGGGGGIVSTINDSLMSTSILKRFKTVWLQGIIAGINASLSARAMLGNLKFNPSRQ